MGDEETMTVEVGGAPMYPSKTIVENAMNSDEHETLVAAVKAAGLVDTLQSEGPFTVFAPTDAAFEALPEGTVESLLEPEAQGQLQTILTYHVIPGSMDSEAIREALQANGGSMEVETVAGESLTVSMNGASNLVLEDASGNTARILTYDVYQSNGVIHVIDTVLLP
ncbi:fasciclin domain-containing protein [Puniceicoccus vermicola]|uniref:Fasciclin domain-containing protein n=1 Tax=Puniceicoccus vermicola TaxID=388746 RepID=A0A7X1AWN8_9BACT|nr:fasciclin domain-containing protein [Puniceicoccus vermicola]